MLKNQTVKAKLSVVDADTLSLKQDMFPAAARTIVEQLQSHGHSAFIVGGGVRDMLLGANPKDFDIATSAEPEQVKTVFGPKCRIIGRRFRLAHVRVQRHLIEVATFRGHHKSREEQEEPIDENTETIDKNSHFVETHQHTGQRGRGRRRKPDHLPAGAQSQEGMVLRDNVFGTIEEDAIRRDFTINALYYDPTEHQVHDFLEGLNDIKRKTLRLIGDPQTRYREDPVRLLRAIRLSQKLELEIAPGTLSHFSELAPLLHQVPAARLFDEVLKFFLSGHAVKSFEGLQSFDLLHILTPEVNTALKSNPHAQALIKQVMLNTDARIAIGKPVTPAFLFAALLWYPLQQHHAIISEHTRLPLFPALHRAMDQVIANQNHITAIPKRFSRPMQEIWEMQYRLTKRTPKNAFRQLGHPRFRAAYDLLLLREEAGELKEELGPWWTDFQFAEHTEQKKMLEAIQKQSGEKKKKKSGSHKKKKP